MESNSLNSKRLILHFDINKTLVISDVAGGIKTEQMVNSLISEAAWGKINPESQEWELLHLQASSNMPDQSPGWMTFGEYMENVLQATRQERIGLKQTFTEEGKIGECLRPDFDKVIAALKLPEQVNTKSCGIAALEEGNVFIVPSFFHLLIKLQMDQRDFVIVFRTFGDDLPKIAEEFNAFCEGRHPMFPGVLMDGTSGTTDRRLHLPFNTGKFYRTSNGADGIHLAMINPSTNMVTIHHGAHDVWTAILQKTVSHSTLGLSDYFPWWRANQESDDSGKLLLVEQSSGDTLSFFFDDNIERDRAHIVDVRAAQTAESLDFSETQNRYLCKAEPLAAILDNEYFVKELANLERNQLQLHNLKK